MNFMVVRSQSPYNGIIGRPGVRKLQAVPSTAHEMLKIPVEGGVITLKSSKLVPLECAMVSRPRETLSAAKPIIEERVKRNLNIFAWKPADMTGVRRHIAKHRLNVREECWSNLPTSSGKAFHKQISRNLEVYMGDLVIKSRTEDEIVRDVKETFKTLREINMKLNPKNCTFGVEEGMFLGFLAKSAEKSLPFFKTLKKCTKKSDFHWTTEAEEAFKQMKQLIAELPMLTAPMEKEELIVYLAAVKESVSAVLMTEREAKQMPIYFVSRALRGPELNYTSMEKLVPALVHASKRLKRPKVSVKGQILADFIVKRPEEDSMDNPMEEEDELPEPWILFTDGSSCTDGSGAGLILTNPEGMEFTYTLRFRPLQANYVLREIHEGSCSMHAGTRSVMAKALRTGHYWPTMHRDARTLIRACMPTLRTAEVDLVGNNEALEINLDLLEEKREEATIREAKSKAKMEKYYNSKVRNTSFKPGDLVYRNNDASRAEDIGKLGPKWEGPYEVTEALGKGTYKLRDRDGKQLSRT
uniref:Reverse transcriptase domain-containing protein n=1 Tax=Tanacetum cinerariifolium TaxID=118510 RepID=A0A699GLV6_TANCI|nr:hypothetical protein [Tanacetum cinerariifolium]